MVCCAVVRRTLPACVEDELNLVRTDTASLTERVMITHQSEYWFHMAIHRLMLKRKKDERMQMNSHKTEHKKYMTTCCQPHIDNHRRATSMLRHLVFVL